MCIKNLDFLNLIINTCKFGISIQQSNGAMPPGKNGPHNHNMTGARTTSHWAILFSYAYKLTQDKKYSECANTALNALIYEYRPLNGAFWHRQENFYSSYNGLIGQAWTLEALYYGYKTLERDDLYSIGKALVDKHPFDEKSGLWYEIDLDGSVKRIGLTLNQQIWFTAIASQFLAKNSLLPVRFLDLLENNFHIRCTGLFYTQIPQRTLKDNVRRMRQTILSDKRLEIDAGYHLFTMVALAMLYEKFSKHPFFQSKKFARALDYTFSSQYQVALKASRFGYPYNVPGFEFPFVYKVFQDRLTANAYKIVIDSAIHQLENHLDPTSHLLTKATKDPITLIARTYEVYRTPLEFWNHVKEMKC